MLLISQIHLNFEVTTYSTTKKYMNCIENLKKEKKIKREIYIKRNAMPEERMYHNKLNVKPSIRLVSKGKTINPVI